MLYEIANALRFHPGATAVDVKEAVSELMAMQVATQDLTDAMAGSTAELAYRENVTFYDAVYLTLAQTLGTKAITADKRLHRRTGEAKGLLLLLENYK